MWYNEFKFNLYYLVFKIILRGDFMSINTDKPYSDIIEYYKEEKFFIKSTIQINYIPNISFIKNRGQRYIITGVKLIESNDVANIDKILKVVNKCDKFIKNDIKSSPKLEYEHGKLDTGTCKLFYVYKDLIQGLSGDGLNFNYFRGQSHDYPLLPGALRYKIDSDYINDFESIYRKLALEFPDTIDYVSPNPISKIVEREPNLSILQHYGLKTALLDITKNPYIAMLFMLNDKVYDLKNPTLYLFKIDDGVAGKTSLFSEVRKSHTNERIIAQKGAFLNFEKVLDNNIKEKIPYVKLVLKLDKNMYDSIRVKGKINFAHIKEETTQLINRYNGISEEDSRELFNLVNMSKVFKIDAFNSLNKDLENKLKEYCYTKEDMFPDFESRIRYISNKYKK